MFGKHFRHWWAKVQVLGKGDVQILVLDMRGKPLQITLKNVSYMPALGTFHLLSISRLLDVDGVSCEMTKSAIIFKTGAVAFPARRFQGLWLLQLATIS